MKYCCLLVLLRILFSINGLLVSIAETGAAEIKTAFLELYGTFNSMGVIVTLDASDDPDRDAISNLEYCLLGESNYRQGFPLTRVADTRFVGNLFWLEPSSIFDVRVSFSDADHDRLKPAASHAILNASGQGGFLSWL